MKQLPVVISGIAGTTAMTAYSFAVSELRNKNFKEPHLLGTMMRRLVNTGDSTTSNLAGWAIHFAVGIALAALYQILSRRFSLHPTVPKGGLIGGATGVAGVLAWHFTLKKHPYPPAINRTRFYGQLIIAHIIFGIVTVSLLRMLDRRDRRRKIGRPNQPRHTIC